MLFVGIILLMYLGEKGRTLRRIRIRFFIVGIILLVRCSVRKVGL